MNLIEALNIKEFRLTEKGYTAQMVLTDFHAQPKGFVNGGSILAFAEVTTGQASSVLLDAKAYAVGQSITANHMKPKLCQGILFVKASLLHHGKKSHVWNVLFFDEEDKLISQVTVSNAIVQNS